MKTHSAIIIIYVSLFLLGCRTTTKNQDVDLFGCEHPIVEMRDRIDIYKVEFTMSATNISFEDAIRYVCLQGGLTYEVEGSMIAIHQPLYGERTEFFEVPENMGKLLRNSPNDIIQRYLKSRYSFTSETKALYDKESNRLIVSGTESNMKTLTTELFSMGLIILPTENSPTVSKEMNEKLSEKIPSMEFKSSSIYDVIYFLINQSKMQNGPRISFRLPPDYSGEK